MASDARILMRLVPFGRPDWFHFVVGAVSSPLLAVLSLAQPYLLKHAVDDYITPGKVDGLQNIALAYLATVLLSFGLSTAFGISMAIAGQRLVKRLRAAVFGHLIQLSPAFFDRRPTGELLTRATSDVEAVGETVSSGVITIVQDVLLVIGVLGAMFYMDWRLTLVLFLVAPPLLAVIEVCRRLLRRDFDRVRESLAALNAYLAERTNGVEVLQLFGAEEKALERFQALNLPYARAAKSSNVWDALMFAAVDGVASICTALILWYATSDLLGGVVSAGLIVAFIEYLGRLFQPLREFSNKITILQRAASGLDKLFTLLDEKDQVDDGQTVLSAPEGRIEFRDVRFSYRPGPPEQDIIKGVSLSVLPGEVVAIVGATGCGKTTLTRLLTRTYQGYRGSITVDDAEVTTLRLHQVRGLVAAVSQEIQLFPETARFNVSLDNPHIGEAQLEDAAELVHADDLIRRLPLGWSEIVKERGKNLSVGEGQLLTFARTMAYDPKVVILDEATASVDPVTEGLIQDAIVRILERKTVIVIAHRLSTIAAADRIVVMDQGKVIEQGRHEELLAKGGAYAALHEAGFAG